MTELTRREFTSICAASLAVPGMLRPSKSKAQANKMKDYFELRDEDYRQCDYSLGKPWFILHNHSEGTGVWLTGILYESPYYCVDVPYQHGFFVNKEKPVWAWGEMTLRRSVVLTRHQKGRRDGVLLHQEVEISACLNSLCVKDFVKTGDPPQPYDAMMHTVGYKHLSKDALEGIDLK